MNLVDIIRGPVQGLLGAMGRDIVYTLHSGETAVVKGYTRGLRAEDTFAAAMQQDLLAVINAGTFAIAFAPRATPARLDRLKIGTRTWSVEEWRGSPNDAAPVEFKLLLRGGSQ